MQRKLTLVAHASLLSMLTLLAACGDRDAGGVGTSTLYQESPDADEPVSGPPGASDGDRSKAQLREPEEGLVDVHERIFDRHRSDGRRVTLFYWSGVDECYGLDHIEIKERARKVVLTIFEGRDPEAEVCTEQAVKVRSIATLQRPLGSRRVVDGAG